MHLSIWPRPSHTWADVHRIATHAEKRGWAGVWFADHFMPAAGRGTGPVLECWSTLAALGATVPRLRIGALVSGNTYRHPAVLANAATTVDHVSAGRTVLGLGAGWQENEHLAYGLQFGSTGERLDRLEEACCIVIGLRNQERTTFHGRHYWLDDARMEPKPVGSLPLLIGGGGEQRTIPIAARYAEEWNVWGTVETFAHKAGILDEACERLGRDANAIRRSTQALLALHTPELPRREPQGRQPAIAGTVESVRDTFGRYAAAGVDEFIVPDFHLDDVAETLTLIDVLTAEVLPALR